MRSELHKAAKRLSDAILASHYEPMCHGCELRDDEGRFQGHYENCPAKWPALAREVRKALRKEVK